MRGLTRTAAGLVLAVLLAGCAGSGSPAGSETSASPAVTPAATLPAAGGLVGAIDSARKLALCENVRLYSTAVDAGLPDHTRAAFSAVLQTLRQAPRDPGLLGLVRRWRAWRARFGDAVTARRLTAFCG